MFWSPSAQSGNMGLWTKDLKIRSNLQQPQINKMLKALEQRKLIKALKSVASSNRKVYMLYELEVRAPSPPSSNPFTQ